MKLIAILPSMLSAAVLREPGETLPVVNPNDPDHATDFNIVNSPVSNPFYIPPSAPFIQPTYRPFYYAPETVPHNPLPTTVLNVPAAPVYTPVYTQPQTTFDPFTLLVLSKSSSTNKLLPLLMMSQNNGQIDPMTLMLLAKDDDSSIKDIIPLMLMGPHHSSMDSTLLPMMLSDSETSLKDVLPHIMAHEHSPTHTDQPGAVNGIHPLMMLALLNKDDEEEEEVVEELEPWEVCTFTNQKIIDMGSTDPTVTINDEVRHDFATGLQFLMSDDTDAYLDVVGTDILDVDGTALFVNSVDTLFTIENAKVTNAISLIDHAYIHCVYQLENPEDEDSDKIADLLPILMTQQQGQPMDPMMMAMLMSGSNSEMLHMMHLMQTAGNNGAQMDPMTMMLLMDEDEKFDSDDCHYEHKVPHVFYVVEDPDNIGFSWIFTTDIIDQIAEVVSDIDDFFQIPNSEFITSYRICLADPEVWAEEMGFEVEEESSFKKMLPFMMMGGFGGHQTGMTMDPMMMYLLMKD